MATLERGKGKRKQVIQIAQHGAVLRLQETDAGDSRLPGYRRFADDAAARAGLSAEVRARLADGMQPADDDARAIAETQPSRKSGPPTLPIRRDLGIYNEATGFVVTSRRMAGKTLDEGSAEWKKAVTKGDVLPLMLVQDDPFIIRVVAGGALTPQEEEEWVARVDWHVNVPDGRLCITGGSVFSNEDYEEDDPHHEQYVGEVELPKGRYRAALYSHVHGVNGSSVLDHLAGGHDKGEPLEAWFARTRPGEERPDWDELEQVDFLLHLEPIDAAPRIGLSVLPEDGWFGGSENARKPDRCPRGLAARDVVRPREDTPGTWTYVRDVFGDMPPIDRRVVPGDAVCLPLDALARAVRIAWFGSRYIMVELRLTPPSGAALDLGGEWPEGVVAVPEGGVGRILFDADLDIGAILGRLPGLATRFASMAEGTVLDVCCAPIETIPGNPEGAGVLSLRGALRGGAWRIAEGYPEADATTLTAALSLAAEIEQGRAIGVRDGAEGAAILEWARRNFGPHLEDNPPKLATGAIQFKKAGYEVALVGIAAFAQRFADTWPVVDLAGEEGHDEDEDEGDSLFPTTPIKGAEVFVAPSGRSYHQTMAMLVSEKIGAEVPKRERPLFGAGFKHVGDVVCDALEREAVRGYARPGGNTWAFLRVSAPDRIQLELVSAFAGSDDVLVTSASAGIGAKDLLVEHERRLAELGVKLGAPGSVVSSARGLAEMLEAALLRSS